MSRTGATGAAGNRGPTGQPNRLFVFATSDTTPASPSVVPKDGGVPFDGPVTEVGVVPVTGSDTTFNVEEGGLYELDFVASSEAKASTRLR